MSWQKQRHVAKPYVTKNEKVKVSIILLWLIDSSFKKFPPLWNPKFRYPIYSSSPIVPLLCHTTPSYIMNPNFLNIILILILYFRFLTLKSAKFYLSFTFSDLRFVCYFFLCSLSAIQLFFPTKV